MGNPYFKFKQFTVFQDKTAMKEGVDGVLLGAWANAGEAKSILDNGTGTGLLSLMLAQKADSEIDAVEIEENAFLQASENIGKSRWANRIKIYHLSIQHFVKRKSRFYDLIICNPPYFSNSLNSGKASRNLARHDDSLPLETLLNAVKCLLSSTGCFYIIYPFNKKENLINNAGLLGLYPKRVLNVKGNQRKEPNRVLIEFCHGTISCEEETMIVRDALTNNYTKDYKFLTRDYYLAF